ncbi:MAG: htrA 2 [Frankiales bacterium]|nr:htrA 2 [Frankiales bacterium]
MTLPAPERPLHVPAYAFVPPHDVAPGPSPSAGVPGPAAAPRPARSRSAALLVAGALLCGGSGAAGALLVDRTGPTAVAAPISRSTGTVQVAASTTAGTAESAAATIAPSVVTIAVRTATGSGTGSGVVLKTDGTILTNNHVVAGATSVTVTLDDGRTATARVLGTDPTSDLAVVRASGLSGLTAAVFADSDALQVGQSVLAVGAPLGLSNTVTEGIVSTLHRPVRTGETATEQSVLDAVQTDAAINPGNSGGALVDLAGRVVGINSAIATSGDGSSGNIGVGFAIPSNAAVAVAEDLLDDGVATHPQLGVSVGDSTTGTGALLRAVTPGGSADGAGLQAGDVVTAVDDRVLVDADSLIVAVRAHQPGDVVTVTWLRGGQPHTAEATLTKAQ